MIKSKRKDRLEEIFYHSKQLHNQLKAIRLLLIYYPKVISNKTLFDMIPFIWKDDHGPTFRWRIEHEITRRQNQETLSDLLRLLKQNHPYYNYFACELLMSFPKIEILVPLLHLIEYEEGDHSFITKRVAVYALSNLTKEQLSAYPFENINDKNIRNAAMHLETYLKSKKTEFGMMY